MVGFRLGFMLDFDCFNFLLDNYGACLIYLDFILPLKSCSIVFHIFMVLLCVYRASHLGLLYLGSLMVLLVYSILYGVTAKEAHWLGAITSAAVIILGMFLITLLVCNWKFVLLSLASTT